MATPLPQQDWIRQAGVWTPFKHETVYQVGSSRLSVSHGFKAVTYSRTLEYLIYPDEFRALFAELAALDYNKVYEFNCRTAGLVKLYVVAPPSYTEAKDGQRIVVALPVERRV